MFFNMLLFCLKGYYETLKEYISRIDKHMNLPSDQLTFTLRKHFKGSSTDKMRRWMKEVFVKNNIVDFSPHSRWAVSTNKAQSITLILKISSLEIVGKIGKTFSNFITKILLNLHQMAWFKLYLSKIDLHRNKTRYE